MVHLSATAFVVAVVASASASVPANSILQLLLLLSQIVVSNASPLEMLMPYRPMYEHCFRTNYSQPAHVVQLLLP
jgi:hypothetical protein